MTKKKKEEKRKHLIIMTVRNCIGRKLMKHVREGKKKKNQTKENRSKQLDQEEKQE